MEKLGPFTSEELQLMLSGEQIPQWTREDIMNYTEPKFGYTRDTPGFQKFVNVLVSMSGDERKVRTFHLFRFISFLRSLACSLARSFGSFVCLLVRSSSLVRSFRSFIRSFVRSLRVFRSSACPSFRLCVHLSVHHFLC